MVGILRLIGQTEMDVPSPPRILIQPVSTAPVTDKKASGKTASARKTTRSRDGARTAADVPVRLREADWDDLVPRVRLWAHQFHRRYLSRVRAAPSPDDLVQEAIAKLFTGQRRLPEDVPLLTVLINNIQSDIWNFLTREGYTRKDSKGKTRQGGGRHVLLEDWMKVQDANQMPANADMRRFSKRIRELVKEDTLVAQMVDLMLEDALLRPRDFADMLNVPVSEINKAQKRLKRKLKHLREEHT